MAKFEIFLVAVPGLEAPLCDEARDRGFAGAAQVPGGVRVEGGWREVWRANLELRGASRVLARIGSFRAPHLAQLDKKARAFPWGEVLRRDVPVRVEASCTRSRIYHSGAAAQRIGNAIAEEFGAPLSDDADVVIKARIEDDLCTLSVDTSGSLLHKRGHKEAVARAPMRETMAAMFLRMCGYDGRESVVDPMCGSGTFVIEAAEIAAGLLPGRNRSFAFEHLASFDAKVWDGMRGGETRMETEFRFHGSDRDAVAIAGAKANAQRAGVAALTTFERKPIGDAQPPDRPPGLVILNPPYGARIGDRKKLFGLYGAIGKTLTAHFAGWRVGLITGDAALAQATGLTFRHKSEPVLHGGKRVTLFQAN